MTLSPPRSRLVPALFSIAALLAACSSAGASPAAPSAAPSDAPASEAPAAGAAGLAVADSSLGQIIVDGEGKTLYMFQPDEAGTPTCYDDCATAWPPLLAADAASVSVATGLDQAKVSVVERTDGGTQVKYGTWPLYYFANDAAAGDTNGQGRNDVWFVVGPDGEPIKGS